MPKRLLVSGVSGVLGLGAGALASWAIFKEPNWGTVTLLALACAISVFFVLRHD